MTTHLATAETIRSQIGGRALFMMGAKNLIAHNEQRGGLSFRTGRVAAGKANYVKIVLNDLDLYDVEFGKVSRGYKVIKKIDGMYFDNLHEAIEHYTGLALSL